MASAADLAPVRGEPVAPPTVVGGGVATERTVITSDWKLALVRLIEALVWPAALVAVALIFRTPLTAFIAALTRSIGH